ncbi:MAG: hypothetical protein ACYC4T_03910 [Melioribacteraceae bacterium]
MNRKALTYFFILVLLITTGAAFSKPANNMKSSRCSGNSVLEVAENLTLGLSASNQSVLLTNVAHNSENDQNGYSEKLSIYLLKNYILSNTLLPFAENTRRTSIRFTSRLKN